MPSLSGVLNIATSGLLAAQTQLRTVSDNVANVSTPDYVRKVADQSPHVSGGVGGGVDITRLRLAADRFLQAAGLKASSAAAGAEASADTLDSAQALFGDPTGDSSFLGGLDKVFSAFSALSADSSAAVRQAPLAALQSFLTQAQGLGGSLAQLSADVDGRLSGKVSQANALLVQIDQLNTEISRASSGGGDVTGSQERQSGLINQLAQLTDVKVAPGALGGVTLRSADGQVLVGADARPAVFSYDPNGPIGLLSVSTDGAAPHAVSAQTSGALAALVRLRNVDLPGMRDQLSSLASGVADALNAAHNAHSAVPAPASLTGRATALSPQEAFQGFTAGRTAVAVTDAAGKVTRRVDVDWAAGTMSVDGGAASSFTPSTFVSSLNTALGTAGSASFGADGTLKLTAASGGIGVADDPAAPTLRAGKTFSGFFGLNDLVTSAKPSSYATGLSSSDGSGFTGAITLRLSDASGARMTDVKVTAPAAPATMADLVSALNSPTGGVGLYGAFALDGDGRLAFTPRPGSGAGLSVVSDTTVRGGAGGPSVSTLFGLGEAVRADRTGGYAVRADIAADGGRLALASFSYAAPVGASALSAADVGGADALGQAGKAVQTFATAGGLPGGASGVSAYAARFGADVARRASDAADAQTSAQAVATEAADRRSAVEGVNLDQELVNLTTYQQAYNASARLVTTVRDMYDVLINMV